MKNNRSANQTGKKRGTYNRKYPLDATTRECRICGWEKAVEQFPANLVRKNGYVAVESKCKACIRALKYGISETEYLLRLTIQEHKCAICREPLPERNDIDHCHETNVVRGILCPPCNKMLGFARDNVNTLRAAAYYLENVRTFEELMEPTK